MPRIKALINPPLMRWARERAGYDVESAAEKLGRKWTELEAWEDGSTYPSLPQARKAARLYRRPLAVFYLPEVPKDFQPPFVDYRRLPHDVPAEFSPELRLLLMLAEERQEWAREEIVDEGRGPLEWVDSETTRASAQALGRKIRSWLGVTMDRQRRPRQVSEALNNWVEWAEERGVFVFQSGGPNLNVMPEEARGLALVDEYSPFIMINAKDSYSGRIFTLVHELVHLWLGASGVSNNVPIDTPQDASQKLEVYCNRATAEALIPARWLRKEWPSASGPDEAQRVERLARSIHVSRESMARRACDLSFITRDKYLELRAQYIEEWKNRPKPKGGLSPVLMVSRRASETLTRMVLTAYRGGEVTGRDVSTLLNVKLNHIGSVAETVGLPGVGLGST